MTTFCELYEYLNGLGHEKLVMHLKCLEKLLLGDMEDKEKLSESNKDLFIFYYSSYYNQTMYTLQTLVYLEIISFKDMNTLMDIYPINGYQFLKSIC